MSKKHLGILNPVGAISSIVVRWVSIDETSSLHTTLVGEELVRKSYNNLMEQNKQLVIYKGKYRNNYFLDTLCKRYNLTYTLRKIHVDPYEITMEIIGNIDDIHDFITLNDGWNEV
jgi:hypothetical protein